MSDAPLSNECAKAQLNECIENGYVIYSRHFKEELVADGLTMQDVQVVCRSGAVASPPEPDIRTGQWKYRIEGLTPERIRVAVIFTFRTERGVLITVFRRES